MGEAWGHPRARPLPSNRHQPMMCSWGTALDEKRPAFAVDVNRRPRRALPLMHEEVLPPKSPACALICRMQALAFSSSSLVGSRALVKQASNGTAQKLAMKSRSTYQVSRQGCCRGPCGWRQRGPGALLGRPPGRRHPAAGAFPRWVLLSLILPAASIRMQVQVVVGDDEPQDNALKRFRREVMSAGKHRTHRSFCACCSLPRRAFQEGVAARVGAQIPCLLPAHFRRRDSRGAAPAVL